MCRWVPELIKRKECSSVSYWLSGAIPPRTKLVRVSFWNRVENLSLFQWSTLDFFFGLGQVITMSLITTEWFHSGCFLFDYALECQCTPCDSKFSCPFLLIFFFFWALPVGKNLQYESNFLICSLLRIGY